MKYMKLVSILAVLVASTYGSALAGTSGEYLIAHSGEEHEVSSDAGDAAAVTTTEEAVSIDDQQNISVDQSSPNIARASKDVVDDLHEDLAHDHSDLIDEHHIEMIDEDHVHLDEHQDDAGEHDHSGHEHGTWAKNSFQRVFAWLGKFHPALTGFPIALLLAGLFAEIWSMARRDGSLYPTSRYLSLWGGLFASATATAGWLFAGFNITEDDAILTLHRLVGTTAGLVGLVLFVVALNTMERRGPFRLALMLAAALAALNGYLGGRMTFGADHYSWPI